VEDTSTVGGWIDQSFCLGSDAIGFVARNHGSVLVATADDQGFCQTKEQCSTIIVAVVGFADQEGFVCSLRMMFSALLSTTGFALRY
jgi:hypothetical protein